MILALLLVGCYAEASFEEDFDAAICDWKTSCFAEDFDTCVANAEAAHTQILASCTYDAAKAHKCVVGLRQLECPSSDTGTGDTGSDEGEFGFPSACADVWDCPDDVETR